MANENYLAAMKIKRRYEDSLLLKKGVVGCGVGLDEQGKPGVVIYVSGEHHGIPRRLDGIGVSTEEIQPDEKWANDGCATAASIEDLDNVVQGEKVASLRSRNKIDAAVAKPTSPDLVVPEILGLGIPKGTREACVGMQVRKSGRTTEVSDGIVRACDVSLFVDYPSAGGRAALFVEQIATTPMAETGDSGSLTVDTDLRAVGLLFAQACNLTLHNRIQNVLDALDVEIWDDELTPELQEKIVQIRREHRNGKKRTERWRPMPMGVSIGHYRGATGTAACLVKDRRTGEILILSNAHVLAMPTQL